MGSLSGLILALSCFFGMILIGIVVGVSYLLLLKMKSSYGSRVVDEDCNFLLFWKKPVSTIISKEEEPVTDHDPDIEKGESNKNPEVEENVEIELRRVHQLIGPPRFLFTIKEESKEDMESECGKSRSKSLSEVFPTDDTSSFSSFRKSFDSYSNLGMNPLFESVSVEEINKLRSSPPPKLKFLRDAEDKRIKKMLMDEYEKRFTNENPQVSKHGAQVLPLSSSPT